MALSHPQGCSCAGAWGCPEASQGSGATQQAPPGAKHPVLPPASTWDCAGQRSSSSPNQLRSWWEKIQGGDAA